MGGVRDNLVGVRDEGQRVAVRVKLSAAHLFGGFGEGRLFFVTVGGRRLAAVLTILVEARFQSGDLLRSSDDLLGEQPDLRLKLENQGVASRDILG